MTDHDSANIETRPLSLSYWAVISALLAVGVLFIPVTNLRLFAAVLAVVAGHAALAEIKSGAKSGKSFATGGLGLGYLGIALTLVVIFAGKG